MNEKRKWRTASRFRRGAVLLGVVGLAAGAAVMSAGSALAAVGADPGGLILNPSSGATTLQPTWTTTNGCPAAEQVSAQVADYTTGGTLISRISPAVSTGLTGSFSGTLDFAMQSLLSTAGISNGGTVEFVVLCYTGAGATGTSVPADSIFVNVPTGGGTFTTSATGPVVENTTTTLIATPNPVAVGATATLTANVAGAAGSATAFPAGNVQFENCPTPTTCTNINTAVPVNTGNVSASAVTTTSFATAGSVNLAAVFTPTATTGINGSTGTFSLAVGSQLAGGTNPVSVSVTVPSTGTLSVTVATGSVTLTPASPATTPDDTAAGTLNTVTISDTRNTSPGWSVSGQESVFTGPGTSTIPANSLGWTPAFTVPAVGGATIGAKVAPVGANTGSTGPGLGTAATLAQALPGFGVGTNTVNAALLLDIPATTAPGAYTGSLTITYVTAGP